MSWRGGERARDCRLHVLKGSQKNLGQTVKTKVEPDHLSWPSVRVPGAEKLFLPERFEGAQPHSFVKGRLAEEAYRSADEPLVSAETRILQDRSPQGRLSFFHPPTQVIGTLPLCYFAPQIGQLILGGGEGP